MISLSTMSISYLYIVASVGCSLLYVYQWLHSKLETSKYICLCVCIHVNTLCAFLCCVCRCLNIYVRVHLCPHVCVHISVSVIAWGYVCLLCPWCVCCVCEHLRMLCLCAHMHIHAWVDVWDLWILFYIYDNYQGVHSSSEPNLQATHMWSPESGKWVENCN